MIKLSSPQEIHQCALSHGAGRGRSHDEELCVDRTVGPEHIPKEPDEQT